MSQSPDEGSGEQEWRRLGEKLEDTLYLGPCYLGDL